MPGNAARCRNGMITICNYTESDLVDLQTFAAAKCKYLVYGKEFCPTTGTPHIQGAFVAKNPVAIKTVHDLCESTVDLKFPLKCIKGPKSAFEYCKKGDQSHDEWDESGNNGATFGNNAVVWEHGEPPDQGHRTDHDAYAEACTEHRNWKSVLNDPSLRTTVAKNMTWAKAVFEAKPPKKVENFVPRPWQAELLAQLDIAPDDRTIIWVYDPQGAAGKTTITNYLVRNKGATVLAGKKDDMLYAYDMEPIIIVDIPRADNMDYLNYGAIEKLKDGVFFSGKYTSVLKTRDEAAHVIVFSNHLPDPSKWTADRAKIIRLSEPDETGFSGDSVFGAQFR